MQLKGIDAAKDKWERLTQRERTMVGLLGITACVMVSMVGSFVIWNGLATLEEQTSDMQTALDDIKVKREVYLRDKEKARLLKARLGQPVKLQGYLEDAAKATSVQIRESNEAPPRLVGTQYEERSVDIQLRPLTIDMLANFLKRIETGSSMVIVTNLLIRTRDDKHKDLDVQMTAVTYQPAEKKEPSKDAAKKKEDKT